MAERCVSEALHEFLGPACVECLGAGEVIYEDLRVTCAACHGSKLRRYTDIDRAGHMQVSLAMVRVLAGKLRWLITELHELDRVVNSLMAAELERT